VLLTDLVERPVVTELGTNASRQCLMLELLLSKLRLQLRVSTLALTFVGSHPGLLRCLQTAVVENIVELNCCFVASASPVVTQMDPVLMRCTSC